MPSNTAIYIALTIMLIIILVLILLLRAAERRHERVELKLLGARDMLEEDARFMASDQMAQEYIQRYKAIVSVDAAIRSHMHPYQFRASIEKLYREGWTRFDHGTGVTVVERTRRSTPPT